MDGALGGSLSAFEVMWNEFYRLVTTPPAKGTPPLPQEHPYYVLVERSGGDAGARPGAVRGGARRGHRGGTGRRRGDRARPRRSARRSGRCATTSRRSSGSACRSRSTSACRSRRWRATSPRSLARLEREWPAYRRFVFGHLGDGNLHIIAAGPPSAEATPRHRALRLRAAGRARRLGVGRARHRAREAAVARRCRRSQAELALMQQTEAGARPEGHPEPGPRAARPDAAAAPSAANDLRSGGSTP